MERLETKILLVEDCEVDQKIALGVLKRFDVKVARTIAEAHAALEDEAFQLILLDVELPDGNGFSFFSQLRNQDCTREIPVIFLTSRSDTPDEVMGFTLGAEDYLPKPIQPERARARIEACLRRLAGKRDNDSQLARRDLRIDLSRQRVFHAAPGGCSREIGLTPLEFRLLTHLLRHEDHVLSRGQLMDSVWGGNVNVLDRTVDMHVSNIRRKITATTYTIEAVQGVGYRFRSRQP